MYCIHTYICLHTYTCYWLDSTCEGDTQQWEGNGDGDIRQNRKEVENVNVTVDLVLEATRLQEQSRKLRTLGALDPDWSGVRSLP